MPASSQEVVGRSFSFSSRNLEWAPKCPCGYGYMILRTSRTPSNPERKFWKCPNLHGERGCGLLIWMDEVACEYIPNPTSGRGQIDLKLEEIKSVLEEIKRKNRLKRESMGIENMHNRRENCRAKLLLIVLLFVAYLWIGKLSK